MCGVSKQKTLFIVCTRVRHNKIGAASCALRLMILSSAVVVFLNSVLPIAFNGSVAAHATDCFAYDFVVKLGADRVRMEIDCPVCRYANF